MTFPFRQLKAALEGVVQLIEDEDCVSYTSFQLIHWGRCDRDYVVVGFTTTCAISAYHHWSSEFESRSIKVYSIQHYVIKFVSDLWQVCGFLCVLWFP